MLNERNSRRVSRSPRALDPASDAFIEQMGVIMASDGFPRIGGRLLALLLITDGDTCLDDIARILRVSKPSVSINARLLEQKGVIEKVSRSADRRDYYRIADDVIGRTMEQRLARMKKLQGCIANARSTVPMASPRVVKRLDEFAGACAHLGDITASALQRLRREPATSSRTSTRR